MRKIGGLHGAVHCCNLLIPTLIAIVEDRGPLIGAPQLLRVIPHLLLSTFRTSLSDGGRGSSIFLSQGLDS